MRMKNLTNPLQLILRPQISPKSKAFKLKISHNSLNSLLALLISLEKLYQIVGASINKGRLYNI